MKVRTETQALPPTLFSLPSLQALEKLSRAQKVSLIKKHLLLAGSREDKLNFKQRLKEMFWHYPVGQAKGLIKGLKSGFHDWLTPFSGMYRSTPNEIFNDLDAMDEKSIRWLLKYFNSDWEKRGVMAGETTVKVGLWVMEAYLFLKKVPQGLMGALRKFT